MPGATRAIFNAAKGSSAHTGPAVVLSTTASMRPFNNPVGIIVQSQTHPANAPVAATFTEGTFTVCITIL
ncbi:MAG: hypothetical protein V9G12_14845 [Microthrixaceae bacterium]